MQSVNAFLAISQKSDVAATTANSLVSLASLGITVPMDPGIAPDATLRISNETAAAALVAQGTSTVDATTDTRALSVGAGAERVFALRPGTTHVAVCLRSGSGTVQICVGVGA